MVMNLFLHMYLGHLIGDFILQPRWLAVKKGQGWRGLILHVGIVTLATMLVIWYVFPNWVVWAIVLFFAHLFIDQFRTFIFTDNSKGKGVILFILDQLAHLLSIVIIASLAANINWQTLLLQWNNKALTEYNIYLLLFCTVIVIIWVIPILEVELAVAITTYNHPHGKKLVPINRSDRWMGGFERLTSLILIVINASLFVPLVFLPRLYWSLIKNAPPDKVTPLSKIGTSFAVTTLIGLFLWVTNIRGAF